MNAQPTNPLAVFDFSGHAVRAITIDGEPWFVAADVCAVLGHGNPTMAVATLDDDERGLSTVETPSGPQQMVIVNEPGLYSLVIRSRKKKAKDFRRWITHEVIPSIRKTGSYAVAAVSAVPALPQSFAEALRALADEVEVNARLARDLEVAEQKVAELEPAASAWHGLTVRDRDLVPTRAAKLLRSSGVRIGTREIFKWLNAKGWIFRHSPKSPWEPYDEIQDAGLMTLLVGNGHHETERGPEPNRPQVAFTMAGLERARALLVAERGEDCRHQQTSLQLVVAR